MTPKRFMVHIPYWAYGMRVSFGSNFMVHLVRKLSLAASHNHPPELAPPDAEVGCT